MQFPSVTGSNLQRKKLGLPEAFGGALNLVFGAWQPWQQRQVDSWLPSREPHGGAAGQTDGEIVTVGAPEFDLEKA
jgi:hypothetical protein